MELYKRQFIDSVFEWFWQISDTKTLREWKNEQQKKKFWPEKVHMLDIVKFSGNDNRKKEVSRRDDI